MEEESPQMISKTIAAAPQPQQPQSQAQHQRNLSLSRPPSFTTDDIVDSSTTLRTQAHHVAATDDDFDDIQFFHHHNNHHLHHQFQSMKFNSSPMSSMQAMMLAAKNNGGADGGNEEEEDGEDDEDHGEEQIISMSPNAGALQQLTDFNCMNSSENPFAFPDNVMEYGEPQFFPGNCVGYLETILEETDEDYEEEHENGGGGEDQEEEDEEDEEGCSGRHWWADSDTDTDSVIRVVDANKSNACSAQPAPANSKYPKMSSFGKPPNNFDRINFNMNQSPFRTTATSKPFEMEDLHLLDQLDLAFEETLMKPRRRTGFAFDQYDLSLLEPALNAEAFALPRPTSTPNTNPFLQNPEAPSKEEAKQDANKPSTETPTLSKQSSQESDDSSEQPQEVNEEDFFYSSPSSQDEDEEGQSNTTTTQSQSQSKTENQTSTSRSRTSSMSSCSSCRSNSSGSTCSSCTSSSTSTTSSDEEGGESQGVVLAEFSLGSIGGGAQAKSPPVSNLTKNNRSSNRRSFELPSASKLRSFRSFDGLNSLSGTDLLFSGADTFPPWNNDGKSHDMAANAEAPPSSPIDTNTVIENPHAAANDLCQEPSTSTIPSAKSSTVSSGNEEDLVVSRKNSGEMSNENLSCDSGLGSSTGNLLSPSTSLHPGINPSTNPSASVSGNYDAANFLGKTEFALNPTMIYSSLSSSASTDENQSGSSFMSFSNCPETNVDDTVIMNKTIMNEESETVDSAPEDSTQATATATDSQNADKNETNGDKKEFATSSILPLGTSMNNELDPNQSNLSSSDLDLDAVQQNNLQSKQADAPRAQVMNSDEPAPANNEPCVQIVPKPQISECGATMMATNSSREGALDFIAAAAELSAEVTSRSLATGPSLVMTNRKEQLAHAAADSNTNIGATAERQEYSCSSSSEANRLHPDQIKQLPEHEGVGSSSQVKEDSHELLLLHSGATLQISDGENLHNPNTNASMSVITRGNEGELSAPTTVVITPHSQAAEEEDKSITGESINSQAREGNIHKNAVKQENYDGTPETESFTATTMLHEYESGSASASTTAIETTTTSTQSNATITSTLNRNTTTTTTNDTLNTHIGSVNIIQDTDKQGEQECERGGDSIHCSPIASSTIPVRDISTTTTPPINNPVVGNNNDNSNEQQQAQMKKKNHRQAACNQQSVLSFDSTNTNSAAVAADENQIQVLDDLLDLLLTKPSDSVLAIASSRRRRGGNNPGAIKSEIVKEPSASTSTCTAQSTTSDSILRESNFGTENVNVNVKEEDGGVGDGEPKEKKARDAEAGVDVNTRNPNSNQDEEVVKREDEERVEVSEALCVRKEAWVCNDGPSSSISATPGLDASDSDSDTKVETKEKVQLQLQLSSDSDTSTETVCAKSSSLDIVPDILLVQSNNYQLNSSSECEPVAATMDSADTPSPEPASPVARQLKTYGEHNQVEVYLVSSRTPSPSTPTNQSTGSGSGSCSASSDQTTILHPQSSSSDYNDGAGGSGTLGSIGSDSTRCGSLRKESRTVHFSPVVSEISWRESYTDQGSEFSESSGDNQLDDDHLARNECEEEDDDDDDDDEDEYDVQAHDARAIEKVRVHSSNITEPDKIWLRVSDQQQDNGASNGSGDGSPDPEERLEYNLELGGMRNKSPAQRPTVLLTMVPDLLSQCEEKVSSTTPTTSASTALSPAASASAIAAQQQNPLHVEGKIDEKLVPQSKKDPSSPSTSKIPSSSSKYRNGYPEEDVIQTVPQPQQILPSKFAASQSKKEKGRTSGNNGNKKSTSGASASAAKNNGDRKQLGQATFLGFKSESSKKQKEKVVAVPEKQPQPQQSQPQSTQSKEKESKPGFFQRLGKLRLSGSSNKKKRDKIYPKEKENTEPPAKKMTTTTVVVTLRPNTSGTPNSGATASAPILKKNGINYQQQHQPYSPPSSTSPEDGVSPAKDQHQKEQEDACSEAFESILDEIAGIKAIQQRQGPNVRPAGSRVRTFAERKQFLSTSDIDQSINSSGGVNEPSAASRSRDGKGIDLLDSKLSAFKEDTHRTRDQISKSQPDLETIERMTTSTNPANKSKLMPAHSTPNTNSSTVDGSPLNTSSSSNTNKKTEREWYKLLKSAAEKYYHGSGKSSKTSKSNPNLILANTNAGSSATGAGADNSNGLPPASSYSKNLYQNDEGRYNGQQRPYGAYCSSSHKTGIVETDLDTGTSREMLDAELIIRDVQQSAMKSYYQTSPTNTSATSGTGTNSANGSSAAAKAKSLTNLTTHGLKLSLVPGATSILDDDNHDSSGVGMEDDERTKSLEFLLDDSPTKRNGGAVGNNYNNVAASYLPPENKLCQENRQLSEHELRIQRSLSKLNVPDWYLRHSQSQHQNLEYTRGGTLPPTSTATTATKLLQRSEYGSHGRLAGGWQGLSAYRTPSLSSLQNSGSGRFSGSLNRSNFVRGRPATMSASAARSSRESLLSPSSTASQSPSAFERSSFTYGMPFSLTRYGRLGSTSGASPASITPPSTPSGLKLTSTVQPYLGWRSQERLNLLNGTANGTSSGPKLSIYRPPAERLAAEVLTLRQQRGLSPTSIVRPTGADRPPLPPQRSEKTSLSSLKSPSIPHPAEVPSIHDSIREVTNAINEFVSLGQEPPPRPTPRQKPNKKQQIVWMESSFVGRRPPENGISNHQQQSVTASPYQC